MIVVTGATGQLGTALLELLPGATGLTRDELDLSEPVSIDGVLAELPMTGLINCAAYTAVDAAEDHEELATVVNGAAVGVLARHAAQRDVPFMTFSTDYVFPGDTSEPYTETSPTDPINAYGRSKLAGERLALEGHPGALVIRASWLVSGTHPNFVATMLRLAADGEVGVVDDQWGIPTVADDLAVAAMAALDVGATGVLHLPNGGEPVTWYGLAAASVELAGLDPNRVRPIGTDEYPTPAARPRFSVLASERRSSLEIDELPSWRESLPGVVKGLKAGA